MDNLEELKQQAVKAASSRGHYLRYWRDYDKDRSSYANCLTCGKQVNVMTSPPPNDIDISGQAVAITCPTPIMASTPQE